MFHSIDRVSGSPWCEQAMLTPWSHSENFKHVTKRGRSQPFSIVSSTTVPRAQSKYVDLEKALNRLASCIMGDESQPVDWEVSGMHWTTPKSVWIETSPKSDGRGSGRE
jgi:hypothetical protein